MIAFARQTWTLALKTLMIGLMRRPISTTIRAFIFPLVLVLIISYAQYFFNPPQHWGVGVAQPILSLSDALAKSSASRDTVAFIDNGLTGGDISRVIDTVAANFRAAGKKVQPLSSKSELRRTCQTSERGTSNCYGAVEFRSSPDEPPNTGRWNYTLWADSSLSQGWNVKSNSNDAQVYILPFQRAIDQAIATQAPNADGSKLDDVQQYPYTEESEEKRESNTRTSYLNAGIAYFGVIFLLGMVGIVYQLTGLVARERERGLSQLIEAMMPNAARWQPQVARLLSTHLAFTMIYFPSWLAMGIILSAVTFTNTSAAIIIFYHVFVGLALASYSLLGAAFFKKAQLSGITTTVIAVVLAIIPQVLPDKKQTHSTVIALSLLFPSANYTYFINYVARWEVLGLPTNLLKTPGKTPWEGKVPWDVHGIVLWIFLFLQIILYPVLAALVERTLWSTDSKDRTMKIKNNHLSGSTVRIRNFNKVYKQHWFSRLFGKRKSDVHAVNDLSLDARKGQIMMLLGPNGSGKSTTLDTIAGLNKLSSGSIEIDSTGGLGIAPQGNVVWDELTVEEHVKIFHALKTSHTRGSKQEIADLIAACDLVQKSKAKAKTLSGGQKRKLQLALMFAGGSAVCCVDEVSSGLDPLSRRKIWDILMAERSDRTIIMTTHFLDEADFLSDHIVILSEGKVKAEGTSAGLKHRLGDGYSVHVPNHAAQPVISSMEGVSQRHDTDDTKYTASSSAQIVRLLNTLERGGVKDYRISGPTLEDFFLRLVKPSTGETPEHVALQGAEESENEKNHSTGVQNSGINLHPGRHISPWRQGWILFLKRFRIFRRSYLPYCCVVAIALIGAGVSPLILTHYDGIKCGNATNANSLPLDFYDYDYSESFGTLFNAQVVYAPPSAISNQSFTNLFNLYGTNPDTYGYTDNNTRDQFFDQFQSVDNLNDFDADIAQHTDGSPGGVFLGDGSSAPRLAWQASIDLSSPMGLLNIMDNILLNQSIVTSFTSIPILGSAPDLYEYAPLLFAVYYGFILACYPAFFALYPTNERLRSARAMQYSNGVRPLPLWLAYIAFDFVFVAVISVISIALLASSSHVTKNFGAASNFWYHLAYLFPVLLLYGICTTLLSYNISMFTRSSLAAWAWCTASQIVLFLAYFAAYLATSSNVDLADFQPTINKIHFTVGLISPILNLLRSLFITLRLFALICGSENNPRAITIYGGPILYLVLQIVFLFCLLLWWDSRFSFGTLFRRRIAQQSSKSTDQASGDVAQEVSRVKYLDSGLRVQHISKSFGKNKAVEDVTFGVSPGEVFALLGPNGAGKSTAISLIRGDIKPASGHGDITVDDSSVITHRAAARANIGVCPQFDATDLLSVVEHLKLYARIRGVATPTHNADELIRVFGLEPYRNRLAQKLSGGTKRKLSLAIALIGNPSVLLLDEPSSGLDASSKRVTWSTLASLSAGRSIVLTTHSMEEADALAHRAGIMSGKILTVGTCDNLRKRWGDVYHVHIVTRSASYTTEGEMERVRSWIRHNLQGAQVEENTCLGQVRFAVPMYEVTEGGAERKGSIGGLFRRLEANKEALGIEYYSIGQTMMDEVFVNIVRRFGGEEEDGK